MEGAIELIMPIGARAIAMGQAAVASASGADALWWNPALIASAHREVALAAASNNLAIDTDIGASVIVPVPRVGAFGVLLRYSNFGEQPAFTAEDPNNQSGTFYTSSTLAAATFAAPFGNRLALGLTYKFLNAQHISCTGTCEVPGGSGAQPQATAMDFGGHYVVTKDSTVALGITLRNLGPKIQENDSPQADPLPTRFEAGVMVSPKLTQLPPEARVSVAADVITRVNTSGGPGYRFGVEASWRGRFFGRAGYVIYGPDGSTGTAFGVGFSTGKLQIDFAQTASVAGANTSPSYLTLRYLF
ncbi:MAG TPA: PorV/PorQ family protein [Gemmatimonadaceae bacterium]|nr:PorV/PorQ family protein [Gemmatimonadaceae bacterium]